MKNIILSLGGSLIMPKEVDKDFLDSFREIILSYADTHRFFIICGGGNICRIYQKAAADLGVEEKQEKDWIGVISTRLNAELVRTIFKNHAHFPVIYNPTEPIDTEKNIIIGAGWKPGCSSDMDAVLIAENLKADTVINLSNIEYVYDKDPKKHDDAKILKNLSWDQLLDITGTEWEPGKNVPFDPTAAKKAKELGLKVIIAKGTDLDNLKDIFDEKEFKGSIIK